MTKAINILEFLKFSEKLKTQERSVQNSNKGYESSADHSWHLALMALLVDPHLEEKVDLLKALKMILVHDLTEAEIGDLPYEKGVTNPSLLNEKEQKEREEIKRIREKVSLIDKDLSEEIYSLWHEYKGHKTKEALFVKALDSIEANFQSIILEDITYWGDLDHEMFVTKADKYCKHEKILEELNIEISERMKKEIKKIKE